MEKRIRLQHCHGLCDSQQGDINFLKKPNYNLGHLYCRICEIAMTQEEYEKLPQLNDFYKYCFCCHTRLSQRARNKYNRHNTNFLSYKKLGIAGVKKNSANSGCGRGGGE